MREKGLHSDEVLGEPAFLALSHGAEPPVVLVFSGED